MDDLKPQPLEYGHRDPLGRRVSRVVPRVSGVAGVVGLMLGLAIWWLVRDHAAWVAVRSFARDPSADTQDVFARSLSADGGRVAVPLGERAMVYEVRTGQEVSTTLALGKRVRSVVLSPDGKRLVTEPDDYTFRLHDTANGAQLRSIGRGALNGAEFTADSARLITWTGGDVTDDVTAHDAANGRSLWSRGTPPGNNWAKFQEVFITADGAHVMCLRQSTPHEVVRITDGQEVPITNYCRQAPAVPIARLLAPMVQPGVRGGPLPAGVTGPGWISLNMFRVASPDGRKYAEFNHGRAYERVDVLEAGGRWMGHGFLREPPLDARMLDDGLLLVAGYHQIEVYRSRRPAAWWGYAWLPAFWGVAVTGVAFVALMRRDLRRWYRPGMLMAV